MSKILIDKNNRKKHNPEKVSYFFKYKDKDGHWRPKYIPSSETTETAREEWKARFLSSHSENVSLLPTVVILPPVAERKSIKALAPWWLAFLLTEGAAPEVRKEFSECLKTWIEPHPISSLDVEKIKPSDAKEFVKHLIKTPSKKTKKPLAPHSIRNVLKTLRTLYQDLVAEEKVNKDLQNPFQHSNLRRIIPVYKNKRGTINIYLEPEVFEKIVCSPLVPSAHRVRFILAAHGAREQEMAGWIWSDLRTKNGLSYLRIERQLKAKISGERKKATLGEPKEEASNRDLPLHKTAREALAWWHSVGWRMLVGRDPQPFDPIFPNAKGEASNWIDASKHLRKALFLLDLPMSYESREESCFLFNFKTLRSTFATWLELAGTTLERRQALMGHTGQTVLDAHYIGRNLPAYQQEIDKLPLPAWTEISVHEQIAEVSLRGRYDWRPQYDSNIRPTV